MRRLVMMCALLVLSGCDGEGPTADGGDTDGGGATDAGPVVVCARNPDCDDGLYCNGVETCEPGGEGAGADGCVPGIPPSCEGECDEDADECALVGCDDDGDEELSRACGGNDCDPNDGAINPSATEVCDAEGVNEDCDDDTIGGTDADGDGFISDACFNVRDDGSENRGRDCDDTRPSVNPEGAEICDGRDNDCDGLIDEEARTTFYKDEDGDGFGDPTETLEDCSAPSGWVLMPTDCDDSRAMVNPAATEMCEGSVDENCSGVVDEGCGCTNGETRPCGPPQALDEEPDIGTCRASTQTCSGGVWPSDCIGAVYPTVGDSCGGGDTDCDGMLDEDGLLPFYRDVDRDGYGVESMTRSFCPSAVEDGYVSGADGFDCNDGNASINPGAIEVCDGIDNDCRGGVDNVPDGCDCTNGATRPCGSDVGECEPGLETCSAGRWGSCVGAMTARPESNFPCNGRDDDCDGRMDEGTGSSAPTTASTWYRDQDGDGFGLLGSSTRACARPIGYVANSTDCADTGSIAGMIRPNVTAYRSDGYCGGGEPPTTCSSGPFAGRPGCYGCTSGPFPICGCGYAPISYDWNCSGANEPQPTGCPYNSFGICAGGRVPTTTHSAGDCGGSVQHATCNVTTCSPGSPYVNQALACR